MRPAARAQATGAQAAGRPARVYAGARAYAGGARRWEARAPSGGVLLHAARLVLREGGDCPPSECGGATRRGVSTKSRHDERDGAGRRYGNRGRKRRNDEVVLVFVFVSAENETKYAGFGSRTA